MKLHILAFGVAKDMIGARQSVFDLQGGETVGELRGALMQAYPKMRELASLSFAVNEMYVSDDFFLKEGDEVVLIPPVSGG